MAHSDLWQDIATAVRAREQGFFAVQWIPAHRTEEDVDMGRIGPVERFLNAGADRYACGGADARPPPAQTVLQVSKQLAVARAFHAMAIEILLERSKATPLPGRRRGFSAREKSRWTGLVDDGDALTKRCNRTAMCRADLPIRAS